MSVEGVTQISSTSRQGSASVTIEFDLSRNIDAALQDVQTRVAQTARRLPREIDPPIITKTNPEDQPIMWLSLAGNRELAWQRVQQYQQIQRPDARAPHSPEPPAPPRNTA